MSRKLGLGVALAAIVTLVAAPAAATSIRRVMLGLAIAACERTVLREVACIAKLL